MDYRLITEDDVESLYSSFISAFSNYAVKMNPTREEFDQRLYHKLRADFELSAGAFDGDSMFGFIVHTSNIYQGIPTAYNGGTGVLPGFRNQKIAEQLYEYLIPKIQSKSLARIILEVVEDNEYAIKLYENIGFHFRRRFLCYKQARQVESRSIEMIQEGTISDVDFGFNDFDSSFLDSSEHLNIGNEKVLLAMKGVDIAGYLVFQPEVGRISQLAVSRLFRHEGFGESLIVAAQEYAKKPLSILNIPEDEVGFDTFLKGCGFENQINQFEMELII